MQPARGDFQGVLDRMAGDTDELELICYVADGWRPRIRAASQRRDWMDAAPQSFPYRCLPLNIANAQGWELLSPCGFTAEWNGGLAPGDVVVRPDPGSPASQHPVALFGQGTVTFHVEGLFRTPPGYDLWIGGPPNSAKDGIAPLTGLIETDWSPYSFTMNWRFTRPGQTIRFEENEPFAFLFPMERGLVERMRPRVAPLTDAPELKLQFEAWSRSRDAFQAEMAANPPATPADAWQKLYYRGLDAHGVQGAADHRSRVRLAEFAGAETFPAAAVCPVPHAPPPAPTDGADTAKLAWIMRSLQTLRDLSSAPVVDCRQAPGSVEFRDAYYAQNRPVLIEGALAGWPALSRWTPEYLKEKVGARLVEAQVRRTQDPDYERRMDAHAEKLPFDQFIDRITRPGAGNDAYITAYNSAANLEALAPLHADLGFLDAYLTRQTEQPHGMMWIGPEGTFTPLHHDLTNNLLLQLVGSKRLILASPSETPNLYNDHHVYSRVRDLAEPGLVDCYPLLDGIRLHEVILEPGDALFLPVGWWHQVTALEFSVSITHTNFHWPNAAYEDYPQS